MNLGILMVQGLVNSFGEVVMAAFAAAVKIDSFAPPKIHLITFLRNYTMDIGIWQLSFFP